MVDNKILWADSDLLAMEDECIDDSTHGKDTTHNGASTRQKLHEGRPFLCQPHLQHSIQQSFRVGHVTIEFH